MRLLPFCVLLMLSVAGAALSAVFAAEPSSDHLRSLQGLAMQDEQAPWGHWGPAPNLYSAWTSHSNRLIPVYIFGGSLAEVSGPNSLYRDADRLTQLFGRLPPGTLNPEAEYFDQTDVARLQRSAIAAGKKRVILFVFDGMDYETTRAAAIYAAGGVKYDQGRGTGLYFQDYRGAPTEFGFCVTSPYSNANNVDVNAQVVVDGDGDRFGGFDPKFGGNTPWDRPSDPNYLISQSKVRRHATTDSSASATSLTTGKKTYNSSVNVDPRGQRMTTIAHEVQQQGWSVGVVTSVQISHATPSCAYAHNVDRDDYQDLSRDLLGLPSVSHRQDPLPGVDVLLGTGWGVSKDAVAEQGANYIPGNMFLTASDLASIDARNGGKYRVVQRTPGVDGAEELQAAARDAVAHKQRLFGFFGTIMGHLPFRTADGGYNPTVGAKGIPEMYYPEDLRENPTLAQMAVAALDVLSTNQKGFWLMVESGDVDWANHDNNLDNSIGAVISGDKAFRAVCDWIESHGGWDDTLLILTSDHGHDLVLLDPTVLVPSEGASIGR
jgi:alkaline phosphatase